MRNNTPCERGYIRTDIVPHQRAVQYPVQFWIVCMVYVGKQVMGNVVIKSAENKIGRFAERVKIIGALYLVGKPRGADETLLIGAEIGCFFHMVCHKKSKKQEERLHEVHGQESSKHQVPCE